LDLPSTGEGILSQYDHPLAKLLLEYRGYEKIITSFGENLLSKINPKTGRVHPDYMQIGADTGRFACSNPNLQQIPSESLFRECFIASPGYQLVIADYSQIELRLMAELSGDAVFVGAFKEDQDLHTLTASQMFGIPIDQVSKEKRFQAKSINFGLMYGRGARSLAVQLGVSEDEALKLLQKYFSRYGKVRDWLNQASKEAVRLGYSRTLGGRKRYYPKINPGDPGAERQISYIERQGKNTPIQGASADMTKYALVYIRERLRKEGLDATPIHTVHDEIVVEARADQAKKTAKLLEEEMMRAGERFLKKVPVKVDAVVSDIWEH
ncbi:MAG: DNA polymerase A family protein, partial [bacterium]|nr:DNA polymerase A family protein [bacterium]